MLQGDQHQVFRHHFWRLKYTELNEIFAFMSLRSLAVSLISIFIPIYLYATGYTLREIIYLHGLMYLVEFIFEYFTAVYIKKIGPKHLIAASTPLLILHLLLLLTLAKFGWPIWTISLTGGLTLALFWQSYHYDFSRAKHRKKAAREVGRLNIIVAILGALAPFIGGFVVQNFGIQWVFALAIVILVFAVTVLFKTSDNNFRPGRLDLKKVRFKTIRGDLFAYGGNMIEVATASIFWPIFLYIVLGNYSSIGAITSIAVLTTIVVTYYVSNKADDGNRMKFIKTGGLLNGAVSVAKVLATTLPRAFGISIAKSFAYSVHAAPFTSEYYIHADEKSRSEYIYLMESCNDLSKLMFLVLMFGLTFFYADKTVLIVALVLGGLGGMTSGFMPPADCEICSEIKNREIKIARRLNA